MNTTTVTKTMCKTGNLTPSLGRECVGPILYDGYLGGLFCHAHAQDADPATQSRMVEFERNHNDLGRHQRLLARIPTWNQDADEELF